MIDGERLHDAIAAFRNSRNLEQDGELTRFLADNDLSDEDFERLVAADEMVRWACGQAERAAFGGLLDDLRLSGEYARLAARVRARLDDDGRPAHRPKGRPRSSGISPSGAVRRSRRTWRATRRLAGSRTSRRS